MPLFQFLAFYQTVEFYFPVYSSKDAKHKIQNLIKDPRFNPDRDKDITKILTTIRITGGGKAIGDERSQLNATIAHCTSNNELREFIESSEERKTFYLENKGEQISQQKIKLKNENADLIHEVSERLYDIRCKIVHTKSGEFDSKLILPISPEVKKMQSDLELIEYIGYSCAKHRKGKAGIFKPALLRLLSVEAIRFLVQEG